MRVICKKTDAKDLNLKVVTTIFSNDFDYSYGGYGLELNKKYIVMGGAVFTDSICLYYLIDTNGRPDWFPHLLFDVIDNSLPDKWFFKVRNEGVDSDIQYLWGFDELCNNPVFFDKLADRDEQALTVYFKRKIEIEKEIGSVDDLW